MEGGTRCQQQQLGDGNKSFTYLKNKKVTNKLPDGVNPIFKQMIEGMTSKQVKATSTSTEPRASSLGGNQELPAPTRHISSSPTSNKVVSSNTSLEISRMDLMVDPFLATFGFSTMSEYRKWREVG